MTYQPTGRIRYWESASARLQAEVATLPGLEQISVSADKALLVARSGNEIVAIDVVSGQVRARVAVSNGLGIHDVGADSRAHSDRGRAS